MDDKYRNLMKNLLQSCSAGCEKDLPDFQNYHIVCVKDKHLLRMVTDEKTWRTPCLIISDNLKHEEKENNNEKQTCGTPKTPVKEEKDLEEELDESLAGSPLKLQEFHVESYITYPTDRSSVSEAVPSVCVVKPLSISKARLLLSLYVLAGRDVLGDRIVCEEDKVVVPLWLLCDGRDREGNVLLGAQVTQHRHVQRITTTTVSVHGPVCQGSKEISRQWRRRPAFCRNDKAFTSKCFAKYSIYGTMSKDVIGSGSQRSLEIHCNWSKMSPLLQPPPSEAKAFVRAVLATGDERSAAYCVYKELTILKGFVHGLKSGLAQWAAKTEDIPLMDRVQILIEDVNAGGNPSALEPESPKSHDDSTFVNAASNLFVKQREGLDFTEELWNILKDCTCFKDLLECLQYVLDCLQKGDFQPVVNRDNKSTLAQLIRDSYYSKMARPSLDGALPLQLLVEIGLEKMANDHIDVFLSKELVTMDGLKTFVNTQGSLSERMEGLDKLHHALELIAMLEPLSLPKMSLSISTRQALKHYEAQSLCSSNHTFTLSIPTSAIKATLDRYQPSTWRVCMTGLRDQADVCAIYLFTETPPFEHVNLLPCGSDGMLTDDSQSYYLTILLEDIIQL